MKLIENAWYPILDSHQKPKPGKILRLKRFSENLVLWRTRRGELSLMNDRCPHKAAPLSLGKIKEDCIQCPYHGMHFDTRGQCVFVPAMGENQKIPRGFGVPVRPVQDKYGFIWSWWGEGPPSMEVPFFPELESQPGHHRAYSTLYPASFHRVMESNLDGYHIDHLHGAVSPRIGPVVRDVTCRVEGKFVSITTEYQKPSGAVQKVTNTLLFPNLSMTDALQGKLKNIIAVCPVDDSTSWFMIRFYAAIFFSPVIGSYLHDLMSLYGKYFIAPPDFAVQSRQLPKETGYGTDQPFLSADRGVLEYWKMLRRELQEQEFDRAPAVTTTTTSAPAHFS